MRGWPSRSPARDARHPRRAPGEDPAEQAAEAPDRQGQRQDRARQVARRAMHEEVGSVGRGQLPLQRLDLQEAPGPGAAASVPS